VAAEINLLAGAIKPAPARASIFESGARQGRKPPPDA